MDNNRATGYFVALCSCGGKLITPLNADQFAKLDESITHLQDVVPSSVEYEFATWRERHVDAGGTVRYELLRFAVEDEIAKNREELRSSIAGFFVLECTCGAHEAVALGPTAFAAVVADKKNIVRFVDHERSEELGAFHTLHTARGTVTPGLVPFTKAAPSVVN